MSWKSWLAYFSGAAFPGDADAARFGGGTRVARNERFSFQLGFAERR